MKLWRETTVWSDNPQATNHWYLTDASRSVMYGYRKCGDGPVTLFRTPIKFSDRGRSFVLEHDFGNIYERTVQVAGSKGRVHTVTLGERPRCSCESFKYRGHCKHLDEVTRK